MSAADIRLVLVVAADVSFARNGANQHLPTDACLYIGVRKKRANRACRKCATVCVGALSLVVVCGSGRPWNRKRVGVAIASGTYAGG